MLPIFTGFRDMTLASVFMRMIVSFICGASIGLEREFKRRPAGLRTHILICIGSAVAAMTGQYLFLVMHYYTDMARIGAQVVAGIGFIGAGTIIVTKRRRVKGLTTAAGLWTNAIIGLSAGAGFYEGAIYTTLIILFLEQFFSKWEYRMLRSAREINLYVEYEHRETLESILQKLREMEVKISDLEVTRSSKEGAKRGSACAVISLMLSKNHPSDEVMNAVSVLEGVLFVEEL